MLKTNNDDEFRETFPYSKGDHFEHLCPFTFLRGAL